MTERERILEKIKRVRALAERGVDGEKDSATALLDRMMEKYGITETELAEERLSLIHICGTRNFTPAFAPGAPRRIATLARMKSSGTTPAGG